MLAPQESRAKSPEAFRTISEVATELDVPQHVLRFWESRFAQVKPVKRAGGRRYYRPEDVDLLRGIRMLLYSDGFTIRGVQKVLREKGLRHVAGIGRASIGQELEPFDASIAEVESVACTSEADVSLAVAPAIGTETQVCESANVVHLHALEPPHLSDASRVRLELLLAELFQLKTRLRAARS